MEKRIYTCATAHLDTVWNWDFEHVISVCLYNTLHDNFRLFEKYPRYKFNFEGSYRYELFEEYYPEEFEKLKEYVEKGRWNVAGSAYENGDVNVPSPEALFRNILYGNGYFEKKFGKRSRDIFLPDCFGFGYALPSIIRHANLLGFTTQKLTWGSAYGTPFDVGRWYGVDGKYCFACLRPGSYSLPYIEIRSKRDNAEKLRENEKRYGLPWTLSFHGTGDQGGSPKEFSVKTLEKEIGENDRKEVQVLSESSDRIYNDLDALSENQKERLPIWNNELVMRLHGAGGYTSRAIGKRWNRRGEELCDMTERAASAGTYLGVTDYPRLQLEKAWKRIIAHQFHDDLPGTSVQRAYQRSWNDYVLSLNQLEKEYTHSAGAVASVLDTSWTSRLPIEVANSLEQERTDLVRFRLPLGEGEFLRAFDKSGKGFPVEILKRDGETATAAFVCTVPSLGCKVFDLRTLDRKPADPVTVRATEHSLENERLLVTLNGNGEIAQIYDKKLQKELLAEPVRHQLISYYGSVMWPAWELTYKSIRSKKMTCPRLKSLRVLYEGAVTAAVEVVQTHGNSVFKSIISLDRGGNTVKVQNEIEWWEQRTLLKDRFAFTVKNSGATYDLGLGAIRRGNNNSKLFEVPAQRWADVTQGDFGVAVLSDSKYGWDKPSDNALRMTVLHTPARNFQCNSMQSLMDLGLNLYSYAICPHAGEQETVQFSARALGQPLTAVLTDSHKGRLGASWSFGKLSEKNVILRALKRAEGSDELVVRFNEGANRKTSDIHFRLGSGILSAREIYADEEPLGEAKVENGELVFDLEAYGIKSFALKLKPRRGRAERPAQTPLVLDGNMRLFTEHRPGSLPVCTDYERLTVPKSLRPDVIPYNGLEFRLDAEKAVRCGGQSLALNGKYEELSLLVFSEDGDRRVRFETDGAPVERTVPGAFERIGVWDLAGLRETAKIKDCDLAYEFTHAHNENGADVVAKQIFVFCQTFDVKGVNTFRLPDDGDVVVLSATAGSRRRTSKLLYPLYDRVRSRSFRNRLTARDRFLSALGRLPYNAAPQPPLVRRGDGYKLK